MKQRILIIDDDSDLRSDLAAVLADAGYAPIACADGQDGLAKILADPPDLVLCDRVMPGMSGYHLLAALRDARPDLVDLPFVFLTALTDARDLAAVAHLRPTLYLDKPIDYDQLLRIIRALLDR